jgi:hypothetical protein
MVGRSFVKNGCRQPECEDADLLQIVGNFMPYRRSHECRYLTVLQRYRFWNTRRPRSTDPERTACALRVTRILYLYPLVPTGLKEYRRTVSPQNMIEPRSNASGGQGIEFSKELP